MRALLLAAQPLLFVPVGPNRRKVKVEGKGATLDCLTFLQAQMIATKTASSSPLRFQFIGAPGRIRRRTLAVDGVGCFMLLESIAE